MVYTSLMLQRHQPRRENRGSENSSWIKLFGRPSKRKSGSIQNARARSPMDIQKGFPKSNVIKPHESTGKKSRPYSKKISWEMSLHRAVSNVWQFSNGRGSVVLCHICSQLRNYPLLIYGQGVWNSHFARQDIDWTEWQSSVHPNKWPNQLPIRQLGFLGLAAKSLLSHSTVALPLSLFSRGCFVAGHCGRGVDRPPPPLHTLTQKNCPPVIKCYVLKRPSRNAVLPSCCPRLLAIDCILWDFAHL